MENKLMVLEELLLSDNGLLVSLRLGDGLKQDKVEMICKLLEELAKDWASIDCIPKKAVDLFIDFYPAMESSCGLYNEEEQVLIMDVADKIMDLIRECVTSN
ncbi:hypothetical protein [Acetivibrio clariflavus]|uniref:Uncharacterized protein n=1 Tax=Acetivibrio clariflavus (strain DSM 19732 / NBRC 101661 / EBR45) TaxID=720554 RepID=G8LYE2_ACECE|nr:hypothetical protein [Acetivibrio clariflavus]AEV68911.1 hypothetical protein Clocl_2325 [Acetivibrio clariflavus DSM 19732]NLM45022.1 hypothetical protein [Clostridiales bacterium]